jgi:hypothetical protein
MARVLWAETEWINIARLIREYATNSHPLPAPTPEGLAGADATRT